MTLEGAIIAVLRLSVGYCAKGLAPPLTAALISDLPGAWSKIVRCGSRSIAIETTSPPRVHSKSTSTTASLFEMRPARDERRVRHSQRSHSPAQDRNYNGMLLPRSPDRDQPHHVAHPIHLQPDRHNRTLQLPRGTLSPISSGRVNRGIWRGEEPDGPSYSSPERYPEDMNIPPHGDHFDDRGRGRKWSFSSPRFAGDRSTGWTEDSYKSSGSLQTRRDWTATVHHSGGQQHDGWRRSDRSVPIDYDLSGPDSRLTPHERHWRPDDIDQDQPPSILDRDWDRTDHHNDWRRDAPSCDNGWPQRPGEKRNKSLEEDRAWKPAPNWQERRQESKRIRGKQRNGHGQAQHRNHGHKQTNLQRSENGTNNDLNSQYVLWDA